MMITQVGLASVFTAATRIRHHEASISLLLPFAQAKHLFPLRGDFKVTPTHLRLIHVALFTFWTRRHVALLSVRVTTGLQAVSTGAWLSEWTVKRLKGNEMPILASYVGWLNAVSFRAIVPCGITGTFERKVVLEPNEYMSDIYIMSVILNRQETWSIFLFLQFIYCLFVDLLWFIVVHICCLSAVDWPSGRLISDNVHPDRSQREAQYFF